jgi:S-DNA-T family DNA segregation ATPase FtsK/SpoIIIE
VTVQVVYQAGARVEDVVLRLGRPDATVGELAAALGAASPDLVVGGRLVAAGQRLDECGLVAGVTVRPADAAAERRVACRAVVRVVGGLSAGRSIPLGVGTATVGRDPGVEIMVDDPAVSRAHCRIEVRPDGQVLVTDLGSRNGTDINRARISTPTPAGPGDLVCVGGVALLRVLPVDSLGDALAVDPRGLARPGGRIPFSRAPRPAREPQPDPVVMPVAPNHGARRTFGITMIAGSLVMAAVTVLTTKDLRYAALAGLSPLMLLANLIEDRTKGRRSLRRQVREFGEQLAAARARLVAQHAAEIRSRHAAVVDPAEALFRSTAPSVRLWERRPPADDFMRLSTGIADLAWAPPVTGDDREPAPDVTEALAAVSRLPAVPVPVDLRGGTVLGLDGNRAAALAVARSLLAQAVSTAGPADLTVAVCTDAQRVDDWDWAKWLPHVADRRGGGSARLLAVGPAASASASSGRSSVDRVEHGPGTGSAGRVWPVSLHPLWMERLRTGQVREFDDLVLVVVAAPDEGDAGRWHAGERDEGDLGVGEMAGHGGGGDEHPGAVRGRAEHLLFGVGDGRPWNRPAAGRVRGRPEGALELLRYRFRRLNDLQVGQVLDGDDRSLGQWVGAGDSDQPRAFGDDRTDCEIVLLDRQ